MYVPTKFNVVTKLLPYILVSNLPSGFAYFLYSVHTINT